MDGGWGERWVEPQGPKKRTSGPPRWPEMAESPPESSVSLAACLGHVCHDLEFYREASLQTPCVSIS